MRPRPSKTVLLTGASAGLGAAMARELARRGHRLALVARREDKLTALADEVRALGGEGLVLAADLADESGLPGLVESAVDRFGRLDVLINNAGFGLPEYFLRCKPSEVARQVAVNLTTPMFLARLALPQLVESRGIVINIGSGITAVPNPIFGAYGTTKAGLAYWNDAFRREVRHRGVRVCLVDLGPVRTDFFDAVRRLDGGARAIGVGPPPDGLYNALRDRPPDWMTIAPDVAARRIAALVEHPRRRLAVPRRVIWPMRLAGGLLRMTPVLGDLAVSAMIRRVEAQRAIEGDGSPPS